LFSHSSNHSTIENKAFAPEGAAKHVKATIHSISASQRSNNSPLAFSAPKLPPLIFSKSTTWLSSDSQATLANVRAFLEANPTARVVFSGHTDDQGTDQINNSLSLERAQEAHDWLVFHGIDPSRIHTQGFGSANPLLPNHSQEARARNRRVEITFR
jgi:outer membrane protein OmpA-like peptidoglycan-associated protein